MLVLYLALWHTSCDPVSNLTTTTVNSLSIQSSINKKKLKLQKYYKCDRCGYVSIVRDSYCPICAKKGFKNKMKQ